MNIRCKFCKREFDTNRQRKDHERNAHTEKTWIEYNLNQIAAKLARQSDKEAGSAKGEAE